MSFDWPLALLLAPVLALALWFWLRRGAGRSDAFPHPDIALVEKALVGSQSVLRHLPLALAALAALALVLALARPHAWRDQPREQATIMLAIDVSRSMEATDVEPYRLRAAQDAAIRFAETVPRQYQVGLVGFSDRADVLHAPSTDRQGLTRAIESLFPIRGTAIGEAVYASIEAVRQTQGADESGALSDELTAGRILLLSDGESTLGRSVDGAAREAERVGIPVFTVALGTDDGILSDGYRVPPNPEALQALSEATGGESFESRDAESVSAVYEELGSFIGTVRVREEVTAWPAGLAALLLLAALGSGWWLGARPR